VFNWVYNQKTAVPGVLRVLLGLPPTTPTAS
jgi:hypothetical protein